MNTQLSLLGKHINMGPRALYCTLPPAILLWTEPDMEGTR